MHSMRLYENDPPPKITWQNQQKRLKSFKPILQKGEMDEIFSKFTG